jgi:hypothetical protein
VLYADWELGGEDHRDRLERLFGPEFPDLFLHSVRIAPSRSKADRIRRCIEETGAEYVICDSVAYAAGGAPESAEVAGGVFPAPSGSLDRMSGRCNIAHVTKPREDEREQGVQKPFGSVFWHNSARATWWVKPARPENQEFSRSACSIRRRTCEVWPAPSDSNSVSNVTAPTSVPSRWSTSRN